MTDDLISRQAAIDVAKQYWYKPDIAKALEELPSAQPQRKTGRWKVSELPKGKMKYCSECGFGQYIADERQYNFCPKCGALMDGEVEGRKK